MEKWKRVFSLLLVCCVLILMLPVTVQTEAAGTRSGSSNLAPGDDGVPTVSGNGATVDGNSIGGNRDGAAETPAMPESSLEASMGESALPGTVRQDPEETPEQTDTPAYAAGLYDILVSGSGDGADPSCFLVRDDYYTVDSSAMEGGPELWETVYAEEALADLSTYYADGSSMLSSTVLIDDSGILSSVVLTDDSSTPDSGTSSALDSAVFADDSFLTVQVSSSDRGVNYPALVLGDVVQTATFNGVFITKIRRGDNWKQDRLEVADCIAAIYHDFDRDHPEVFWLSDSIKAHVVTVDDVAYFFLVLADTSGFTMRAPDWTAAGSVASGIQRREAAIETILSTVTGRSDYEKVVQLNRWLTLHNEYNRSADLTTTGNEPHECLSALEGRSGTDGPVCEGYSRAFKTLCDRLGIPCVLEDGYARRSSSDAGETHMWNLVKIGGGWYGVDVTWNDPIVTGITGAVSGYESEKFLLVGADTEINGLRFADSHPMSGQAAVDGVSLSSDPVISLNSYDASVTVNPFTDVSESAYYYDAVQWAVENGVTAGAAATVFGVNQPCTRGQMVTFLWQCAGEPEPESENNPFTDVPDTAYYHKAVLWAVEHSITNGTTAVTFEPDRTINRGQAVAFLYRYAGNPTVNTLSSFADVDSGKYYAAAVAWAVGNNITNGKTATLFAPEESCTRAQIITFLFRAYA